MLVLLANPPADVQAGQIAHGQRPHRHAVVVQHGVDLFDLGPFLQQELGLALIVVEHAIADKPAAVAHQNADLVQLFRQRHRRGDHRRRSIACRARFR